MAIQTKTVTVAICDACGKETSVDDVEGWFVGEVIFHASGGGYGDNWHACKVSHIKHAVQTVVDRDY